MKRSSERLIDVLVLTELLVFAYAMRTIQPALAGVITAAAVGFWLSKNASPAPSPSIEEAAALAAASVLATARSAADEHHDPG
jgi:hypothetical protein